MPRQFTPGIDFDTSAPCPVCDILIHFLLFTGVFTGGCIVMALLNASPWKPSPHASSGFRLPLVQNFVSVHPPFGAPGCEDGLPLAEGDPGLLCTGGPEEGVDPFAHWAASPVVVFYHSVLDLASHPLVSFLLQLLNS